MKKIRQGVVVVALVALPLSSTFAADGDFSATVGLKLWNNNWSSWATIDQYNGPTNQGPLVTSSVKNIESSDTQGWIPSFSVRYKDFMLGGSYFAKQSYDFVSGVNRRIVDPATGNTVTSGASVVRFVDVKREEFDLIGGYYVLPTLAVIAGYKEIDQWWSGEKWKYSGPIVGASASAPLTGGFSLYGSAALGPMKLKEPNGVKSDADYRLGEVGLAYAFDMGGKGGLKSVIGTVGYRAQTIVTKLSAPSIAAGLKARDTTEGFTVGVVAAF